MSQNKRAFEEFFESVDRDIVEVFGCGGNLTSKDWSRVFGALDELAHKIVLEDSGLNPNKNVQLAFFSPNQINSNFSIFVKTLDPHYRYNKLPKKCYLYIKFGRLSRVVFDSESIEIIDQCEVVETKGMKPRE